ncbi:hypothetical protein Y032_0707g1701 [Ancylostoma ceylanicum]|nr:hypothetical protein Y032_0707g1701 [Ancylostoma ceylanicum]
MLIIVAVNGGVIPLSENNDEVDSSSALTLDPKNAPQKIDGSSENPAQPGPFDLQKMLEVLNTLARSIFAPFQPGNGGASPFNLRLPTLTDLFKLPSGFLRSLSSNPLPTFKPFRLEELPTLPTFAPLTLPDFLRNPMPTLAPIGAEQCLPKLRKEFKENDQYFEDVQKQVDAANISAAYDVVSAKAAEICTPEQMELFKKLMQKYETLKQNIQALVTEYPKETRDKVLQWLREENFFAISGFITQESMANLFNTAKNTKLMQISFQLTSMQIDLIFNPI